MRRGTAAPGRRPPLLPPLLPLLLLSGAARCAANSCGGAGFTGIGTTYPIEDLNLLPGTAFNITCQLDPSKPSVAGYTSRDIYFSRMEIPATGVASRLDEVPIEKYEIVNDTTVRLSERLSRRASYNYVCRLRHRRTSTMSICTNHVNVGDPPLPVQDFRCVSQNWYTLNCSWLEPYNAIKTSYQLEYRLMSRVPYRKPCNISAVRPSGQPRVSCLVSKQDFRYSHETFRMVVNAHNARGNNTKTYRLNTYEIVRPAAPARVWFANVTAQSLVLRAQIGLPMVSFPRPIEFDAQYTSRWSPTPQVVDVSAMRFVHGSRPSRSHNTTQSPVAGLLPYTEYRFAVRMRSSVADVSGRPELWSDPRQAVVRTLPTVPSAAPRTTLGSFQLEGNATSRSVYVYWQQIAAHQQNGPDFSYCAWLRVPGGDSVPPDRTTAAYALFRDRGLRRLQFSVAACNSEGRSADSASLVVPAQQHVVPRPHPITLVAEASGNYTLAWDQKPDTSVDSYTLFWCQHTRGRPYQCEGQLNWTVVEGGRRNHTLRLPRATEYQFAVAANRAGHSSGLVWSRCVRLAEGERTPQLEGVRVQGRGARELTLAWRDYCSSLTTDAVSYKVYYCAARDGQCLPGHPGEERSALLTANASSVRLAGLAPYTQYRLQVAVKSGRLEGQRSQPVVGTTKTAPPEPPTVTQVTARNASSLLLVWAAPARPNGLLTQYQLERPGAPAVPLPPTDKTHLVTGLDPFTCYQFRLSACTKAGCSPSAAAPGCTAQGRPGAVLPPRAELINATTVRLRWRPPDVRGGPEPRYWLRLVSERPGRNTNSTRPLQTSSPSAGGWLAEYVSVCAPGVGRHLLSVRASVEVDGLRLDGPWSPDTEQQCVAAAAWPTATIVGVVVGGAALMMCVVLLFFLLCQRTKRKLSEMRNLGVNMPAGLERPEKAHGFPGGAEGGYGRLVSQSSGAADRSAASVSGQPLLQEDLARDECDGEGSELTPVVNTDSNSCSSGATNYTDSGAECDKGASSPGYKFQWPAPAESPKPQLSPYVQAGGPEMAAAAAAGPAPPYTKFSPYVDAKAIQALVARGRSMESLPAGGPAGDLSRSEPDLSALPEAGPPPPYSQIGHRSSTGYVSMASEDALPAGRLASPPQSAAGRAKPRPPAAAKPAELKPYVALGPPPPPASAAGFPPYVLAGPPPGEGPPPVGGCSPARGAAAGAAPPGCSVPGTAGGGYVQPDKLQPQMELRDLPGPPAAAGYVSPDELAAGEPVLSPKKLPTVATAREPYCRVVTSHQGPPDLGPNVSMV